MFLDYPEKSWSLSKQNVFDECKRKYFFKTYAHWKGWEPDASEFTRKAYLLNKLQNIYALLGQAVHDEVKKAILNKKIQKALSIKDIREKLNEAWKDSINNRADWERWPKEFTMLQEIYYGNKSFLRQNSSKITKRAEVCIENFSGSEVFKRIKNSEFQILEVDEDFPSFKYNGVRVFSIIDFLYKTDKNSIYIVDWKTGRPNEAKDKSQLKLYTIYVLEKYKNADLSNIKCVNEYLLTGDRAVHEFSEKEIANTKKYIEKSISEIDKYCEDPQLNKPKDISFFKKNPGRRCNYCEFLELCKETE